MQLLGNEILQLPQLIISSQTVKLCKTLCALCYGFGFGVAGVCGSVVIHVAGVEVLQQSAEVGGALVGQEDGGFGAAFLAGLFFAGLAEGGGLCKDGLMGGELLFVLADEDVEDWGRKSTRGKDVSVYVWKLFGRRT